jgi:hypothetical protein
MAFLVGCAVCRSLFRRCAAPEIRRQRSPPINGGRLGACPLIESKALLAELLGDFACPRLVYVDHIEGARIASLRPCAKGEAK